MSSGWGWLTAGCDLARPVEGEVQMKRPQCALLAEACRLLGAVLALTSQGGGHL